MTFMVFDTLANEMVSSGMSEMEAEALACTKGGERLGYYVYQDSTVAVVESKPRAGELF